jgi:hypothetical protein
MLTRQPQQQIVARMSLFVVKADASICSCITTQMLHSFLLGIPV